MYIGMGSFAFVGAKGKGWSDRRKVAFAEAMKLSARPVSAIDVPNDIAIVGVDDNESLCENTVPTLSSVRPDFQQGGRFAAQCGYRYPANFRSAFITATGLNPLAWRKNNVKNA